MTAEQALHELRAAVVGGNRERARSAVSSLVSSGLSPESILNESLVTAMEEVGARFRDGVYFVPQVLLSARAMKEAMAVLEPILRGAGAARKGVVVIGTVRDDLHDIGKNLVATMLEGGGFQVLDLGVDVRPPQFLEAATTSGAVIVALSALLTTTMQGMETTVALIRRELGAKTLVGGAPVTASFACSIGADGYAPDAVGAVAEARRLVSA